MSSIAQIEANRRNAERSTGPRTPEGVAACCRNATRHGLFSSQCLSPGESAEEFAEHRRALIEDLAPQGAAEELLADRAVQQSWRLRRIARMDEANMEEALGPSDAPGEEPAGESGSPVDGAAGLEPRRADEDAAARMQAAMQRLDLLRRYERAVEQGFHQALAHLRASQKARRDEDRRLRQDEAHLRQEEERRIRQEAVAARQAEEAASRRRREAQEEAQRRRRNSVRSVEGWIAQEEAAARAMEIRMRHERMAQAVAEVSAGAGGGGEAEEPDDLEEDDAE